MVESKAGSDPFRWWVFDDAFAPLTGELPPANWSGWEVAYDNDVEARKLTTRDVDRMPDVARDALLWLETQAVVGLWAMRTGIDTLAPDPHRHGAGLHVTLAPGFLQVHVDYERHPREVGRERRLNLIAFLHPEWRPEWGGQLLLCDPSGNTVQAIEPVPGRLVAFECGPASYHGVRQLAPDAPPRASVAVYYLADARPTAVRTRAVFLPNRRSGRCPAEVA